MCYLFSGDITLIKNTMFKDTNTLDLKKSKRPHLLLADYQMMDDKAFLLKLSTTVGKGNEKYFFKLVPNHMNRLKKVSYVDLRYVVEKSCRNNRHIGTVPEYTLKKIHNQLDKVQSELQEESYLRYKQHKR